MSWEKEEVPKKNTKGEMKAPSKSVLNMFKPAIEIPAVKCLRCGVFATAKSGKTHWALTAKRPIYFLDTEKSAAILVKQLPEEVQREIFIVDLVEYAEKKGDHMDVVKSMEVAFDIIGQLIDVIQESPNIGTIVIDSMSDLWDFLKMWLNDNVEESKKFGDTIMGTEWGKANKRWTQLMRLLQASDWNVILTFKAKQKYDGMKATGIYEADWQKNTFHWLDLNIEIQRIGNDHRFVFQGGRFGDTYETMSNPTYDDVRNYLTQKSGVKFE